MALLVQTYGLHLGGRGDWAARNWAKAGFADPPDTNGFATLFSCIVALDRLNAALHGRPVLFNDQDMVSISNVWIRSPDNGHPPSFSLFMSIIYQLDKVVDLYRPYPKDPVITLPVFEELVLKAGAVMEPQLILGRSQTCLLVLDIHAG